MANNSEWTNNEASRTKLAISELGYIDDHFMRHFCGTPLKRTPEINRGYFIRAHSVAHSVRQFCLKEGATSQIVNIGGGFDSLFWRLSKDSQVKFSRYVDVDCNEVIDHKVRAIKNSEELLEPCGDTKDHDPAGDHFTFHSAKYHAIAQDASKSMQLVKRLVDQCKVEKGKPIVFVFECVLLYWEEDSSTNLIYALNKYFPKCNFVIFDLVNTTDKFSHLMQQTLFEQHTPLLGAASVTTLDEWNQKFQNAGSKHVKSWCMTEVYTQLIDPHEKSRIEQIEFLDEIELLTQLLDHYCLVLASNFDEVEF